MTTAYVDTSAVVAIDFSEPGGSEVNSRLGDFSSLISSNLLEAEVRAVYMRDGRRFESDFLSHIQWVFPGRSLAPEFEATLRVGYLRGADLWHVATALYVAGQPSDLTFLSLDQRQRTVAAALGFQT